MIVQPTRRSFLVGLGFLATAPAIVRASSLMPIYPVPAPHLGGFPLNYGFRSDREFFDLLYRIHRHRVDHGVDGFGRPLA